MLVVYHGTDADFTVFDRTKGRSTMDIQGSFFSPWEIDAGGYGSNTKAYYLNIKNPASEAMGYKSLNKFKGQNDAGVKAREYLESLGYDGVNNGNEEYIIFNSNQAKLVSNENPTEDVDIRLSLKIDVEKELDYFNVSNKLNDYIGVQKRVISKLDGMNYFGEVTNKNSGMIIDIGKKGIKETLGSGKRFQNLPRKLKELEIATIRSLPEIIKDGVLIEDNVENKYGESALYAYFKVDTDINGEPCVISFDVRKTSAKNKFYIHSIHINKENSALLNPAEQDFNETQNPLEKKVSQNKDKVKKSLKDNETLESENKQLIKDNEHYKKLYNNLKAQFKLTKGHKIGSNGIGVIARWLKTEFNSAVNITELRKDLNTYFNMVYAQGNDIENSDVVRMGESIIRSVIEQSKDNGAISEYGRQILNEIKKTKIKLSDAQVSEIQARTGDSVNEWS